jgi:amino acid transporter
MNAMIGSGIFTAPATMAANVGPAGILAYGFVVISVLFMALALSRLAQLFPQEGSFYLYASRWGGHAVGLCASAAYFIGLLIAMGLLAQMSGPYLHTFFPSIPAYTLGLCTLAILVFLNLFGVVLSELGQHVLIACTVFPLIATTILCLTKANFANLIPFAPYGFGNVLKATRVVIFGFFGFECAASLFNIVEKPEKNVPRALTWSIILVGILYTLFVTAIILSTPLQLFTDPRMPLSDTLSIIFPEYPWLITLIHFSILSAIIGTIHSMIWASSNLLTLLFKQVKKTSKTTFSPRLAVILVGACIALTYTTLTNLNLFFYLTAIFLVIAYGLSLITLLFIDKEWKSGQNIITVLGLMTAGIIFFFAAEGLLGEIQLLF